jgi:hypothetical protein
MIGSLAQKRTHLAALAVLVALAVAMFAVIQSASADAHTVTVTFNDSDGIVDDGAGVTAIVKAHFTTAAATGTCPTGNATLNWIRVPGDLSGTEAPSPSTAIFAANPGEDTADGPTACTASFDADGNADGIQGYELINPKGAAEGVYVVSAEVSYDGPDDDSVATDVVGSAKLTIGDAGTALAAAEIGFGKYTAASDGEDGLANNDDDVTESCAKPGATETADDDAAAHGGKICLFVTATNALGNPANGGDVDEIVISAPTGAIHGYTKGAADTGDGSSGNNSLSVDDESANTKFFTITRTGAGQVTVSALVIGSGTAGFAAAPQLVLSFAGPAATFEVADATQTLHYSTIADAAEHDDEDDTTTAADDGDADDDTDPPTVRLLFAAADTTGNPTSPAAGPYTITIKDADDKAVASDKISASQPDSAADKKTYITLTGLGTESVKLVPGVYTAEVKRGTVSDTASFSVSAGPGSISLELESTTVEVGQVVMVTATVTDGEDTGNTVIDGTPVTFEVAGALSLKLLGADSMTGAVTANTKGGVASARALVSSGSGSAAFVVSAGTIYQTISVSTDAAAEAAPEAVSLDCLSATNGFATYTCDMDSSASELFGLVSGRGATAVHLWNGSDWVRYSVVDGAMVPGSSDFTVTDNDILYISN